MTNFRPTTLSPEALKVWDEAEANIQASLQRIRELTAPVRKPAPKEPTTRDKKPLSLVCDCHMRGMPPNPHQDWKGYFDHCAATGTISGLRFEAIWPTPSVNDTLPRGHQ